VDNIEGFAKNKLEIFFRNKYLGLVGCQVAIHMKK